MAPPKGFRHSEESKKKMSEAKKGKPRSPAAREAIAAWWRDNTHSAEARAKISAARMGHEVSASTRAAVSAAQKRRWAAYRELKALASWKNPNHPV